MGAVKCKTNMKHNIKSCATNYQCLEKPESCVSEANIQCIYSEYQEETRQC